MARDRDFLEEVIQERTERNPDFPRMVDAALHRRELIRELAERRKARGITQKTVAEAMGTSQPSVNRMEVGETDVRFSTIERYAAAVHQKIEWHLVDAD
jgi:DNA-binding XRE family transcriptional regulator